jgi:hypothetical protein
MNMVSQTTGCGKLVSAFDIVSVLPITVKGRRLPEDEGITGQRLDNMAEMAILSRS